VKIILRNAQRLMLGQSIPTGGVSAHGTVAVATNILHNAADNRLNIGQISRTASGQRRHETNLLGAVKNTNSVIFPRFASAIVPRIPIARHLLPRPHHITTLFSGYSTMP
jgi:hypothetical protein